MQIDMSMMKGAICHLGLRSWLSSRSALFPAGTSQSVLVHIDPPVRQVVHFVPWMTSAA
ncbi:MAG: hypothetical protein QOD92_1689 [Acidimicrobiaceae bacterium]